MATGRFTDGVVYELPHPRIQQRTLLLICRVIRKAWQLLREDPEEGPSLQSAHEKDINRKLVWILENRLRKNEEVAGFNSELFGNVERDPKIINYNNKSPDKMPDIVFRLGREKLTILSEQDGLFVECKPLDTGHPVLSCYCKKGLIRFVNGDYAWAMQDALMVGYERGKDSYDTLARVLDDRKTTAGMNIIQHFLVDEHNIYQSEHARNFEVAENRGPACSITVSHLWLRVERSVFPEREPRVLRV